MGGESVRAGLGDEAAGDDWVVNGGGLEGARSGWKWEVEAGGARAVEIAVGGDCEGVGLAQGHGFAHDCGAVRRKFKYRILGGDIRAAVRRDRDAAGSVEICCEAQRGAV